MEQKRDKPLSVVKQCSQETLEIIDKFLIDLYKDLIRQIGEKWNGNID